MALNIKKAVRENIWIKIALMSPSGGGKTYSALRLATGMKEEMAKIGVDTKILMINTEAARGKYYANEFEYDILDILSPHHPEKYVDALREIQEDGSYKIVIMDSTSHEWEGKGGCLELQQEAGGTYQAWAKVTPRHNNFIEAIADSELHIIATMRGKDQYEMEKSDTGKISVKKLGVGSKQRDGFEYEFTATFLLDQQNNMAKPQKDNTHLFDDAGSQILTERIGVQLIQWANSGEGYTPVVRHSVSEADVLKGLRKDVIALYKVLGGKDNTELVEKMKQYEPTGNPNKIDDAEELVKMKSELELMQEYLQENR